MRTHLQFLALMVPTVILIVLAVISLAAPVAQGAPMDETRYQSPY